MDMIKRTYGYDMNLDVNDLTIKDDNIFDYFKDYNCLYLDSGRSCVKIICQLAKNKEMLIPAFSCSCIVNGLTEGAKPVFYRVNTDFTIDFEDLESKITDKTSVIYVANNFGHHISDENAAKINAIKKKYGLYVVEDNTQAIFSGDLKVGDYGLGSIRKWFPVPDGGLLYSKKSLDIFDLSKVQKGSMQKDKLYPQILKDMYLKGMVDYGGKQIADLFEAVENCLNDYADDGKVFFMDDFTEFMYRCFSVKDANQKRKENYRHLVKLIDSPYIKFAMNHIDEDEVPFNLPLYCECRDEMWNYLVDKYEVFPSVFWRTHLIEPVNQIDTICYMGEHIMCIPVDQRYDKEDMEYLAKIINEFRLEK